MKIVHQDTSVLQLRPRGGWILLLIGALMLVTTPVWLVFLGQSTHLECERTSAEQSTCRLTRTILNITTNDRPLEGLTGAQVSQSTDSDGDTMYRVVLETAAGDVALTSSRSSNRSPHDARADEINRFLADANMPSLTLTVSGTIGWIVSGVLALVEVGLFIAGIQAMSTTWTFDKTQGTIIKYRRGLTGPRGWQYDLREINGAIVSHSRDSDGDTTYRVELVTEQGQRIPMTSWYSSGYTGKERTATVIQQFLDQA